MSAATNRGKREVRRLEGVSRERPARERVSMQMSMPVEGACRESAVVIRPNPAPISRIRVGAARRAMRRQKVRCADEIDSSS